jgi:hypothetical protein
MKTRISTFLVPLAALLLLACGGDKSKPTDTQTGDTSDTVDPDTTTCPSGTAGCPCADAQRCDSGLACVDGRCAASSAATLRVSPAAARACDILLADADGAKVARVVFGDAVKGHAIREGARTAVSVIANADADFPEDGVALELVGDAGKLPTIATVRCADRLGKPLANASATLD